MPKIKFPALYETDNSRNLRKIDPDIQIEPEYYQIEAVVAYTFDNISPYVIGSETFTAIRSGQTTFICPYSPRHLEHILDEIIIRASEEENKYKTFLIPIPENCSIPYRDSDWATPARLN